MGLFGGGDDDTDEDTGPSFEDVWEITPDEGSQQWEYRVLSRSTIRGALQNGPHQSPEDVFNEFGKEGWELVETVESLPVGQGSSVDGTVQFLFKRPVTYRRRQDAGTGGD